MESLLHYENLRGKVQMIYVDPPYGIKYDSNFQQRVDSTTNDQKDAADDILTIKAFRDTWSLGVHSYLTYLQERLFLSRELLTESGSVFVQISDDNMHLVRVALDEVFGAENFMSLITFKKTAHAASALLPTVSDYLVWYALDKSRAKYVPVYVGKRRVGEEETGWNMIESPDGSTQRKMTTEELLDHERIPEGWRVIGHDNLTATGYSEGTSQPYVFDGRNFRPSVTGATERHWKVKPEGLDRLAAVDRLMVVGNSLRQKRYLDDFPHSPITNLWEDTVVSGFAEPRVFVVQTNPKVVERCIFMTTSPGDVVLDPTCGSGTTAICAERLGRRWVTCDTSRVAVNVARQRLIAGTFEHYKTRNGRVSGNFLYKTVNRVTLKSLAYDLEPEKVELVDQPEVDKNAIRVCGPFEVMSLGRYSVEDWKGYVVQGRGIGEAAKLENYIAVICRLYRKDAALQEATGLVHAVAETEKEKIAISVGPLSGRVTGKQINDAVQDALASGILEVHALGWAFEANVGEVKSALEKRGKVKVELVMIRPDTLAEGLKATQPEMLFSPLALPDIEVVAAKNGKEKQVRITLNGVALFDRKRRTTEYKAADSGYVSAWYLDEDYDGDCFVDCQMFFDFKKKPNIKAALKAEVDAEEFTLKLDSEPFPVRGYQRIAVKVVDVYGNESTVVRDLT